MQNSSLELPLSLQHRTAPHEKGPGAANSSSVEFRTSPTYLKYLPPPCVVICPACITSLHLYFLRSMSATKQAFLSTTHNDMINHSLFEKQS